MENSSSSFVFAASSTQVIGKEDGPGEQLEYQNKVGWVMGGSITMDYTEFIKSNLSNRTNKFTAVKFFKHFKFTFSQKKHAEKVLIKALQKIGAEKDVLAEKTMSFLSIFDEHIHSFPVQQFWDSIRLNDGREKTGTEQENEASHLHCSYIEEECHIRFNALEKHINESDEIIYRERRKANELETRPQQKKLRYYSPNCSEDDADSEIAPISLTHVLREIFENSVKSQDKIVETESVTYLGKAVELEPNNLELEPKNLDDAAELGFNLNENVELEPEDLDHTAELENKDPNATKLDTSLILTKEVNVKKENKSNTLPMISQKTFLMHIKLSLRWRKCTGSCLFNKRNEKMFIFHWRPNQTEALQVGVYPIGIDP
ncbi:20368_t:CDS:2, partial [Cetraspora pellucida]